MTHDFAVWLHKQRFALTVLGTAATPSLCKEINVVFAAYTFGQKNQWLALISASH